MWKTEPYGENGGRHCLLEIPFLYGSPYRCVRGDLFSLWKVSLSGVRSGEGTRLEKEGPGCEAPLYVVKRTIRRTTVVLFLSDMHFGRESRAEEREKESALIECLDAHADRVRHLYLLGDVFDGYIEYRHLIPKGFVRFQALLARWTDRGIPVTYLFGNHDPWHRDYFAQELGVTLVPGTLDVTHADRRFHLAHGDGEASTHASYAWLRPLLRHPWAVGLYRSLLPADVGLALAHRVSRALHDPVPDPAVVRALRVRARALLDEEPFDTVVMGHSHEPALHRWPDGVYVNTGNWYEKRTFARLENGRIHLARWNGTRALDIESAEL